MNLLACVFYLQCSQLNTPHEPVYNYQTGLYLAIHACIHMCMYSITDIV